MRVLAYEGRRLLGLRSTWLIVAAALLADAVIAAVISRQTAPGPLPVVSAIRLVTAAVPLLPIPLAALAAGALGALASAHEVRHPGLAASQVRYDTRVRLLTGKLAVVGAVSALLAVGSLLLDALVVRIALLPATSATRLYSLALLSDPRSVQVLVTFTALVVAAGWTGVLAAALTRSAAAGILLLCALPMLVEPLVAALLQRAGSAWAVRAQESLPIQYGLDRLHGAAAVVRPVGPAGQVVSLFDVTEPLVTALVPAALLLVACLAVQVRRRSF